MCERLRRAMHAGVMHGICSTIGHNVCPSGIPPILIGMFADLPLLIPRTAAPSKGEPLTFAKQLATLLLRSFSSDDKVAVVRFTAAATTVGPFGNALVPAVSAFIEPIEDAIAADIETLHTLGRANISAAMSAAFGLLKSDNHYTQTNREQLIFVLSDGGDGKSASDVYVFNVFCVLGFDFVSVKLVCLCDRRN
jgi:hypothetical protein